MFALILPILLLLLVGCGDSSRAANASSSETVGLLVEGPPIGAPAFGAEVALQPQRLEIPAISVDANVTTIGWEQVQREDGSFASEWEVADFAAGWHKNSALPGEGGNVVMSGHNNIRGAIFKKLYTLEPGDEAYVWAGGRRYTYRVEEVMVLEEKFAPIEQRRGNAQWITPFDDDRLTLVSCWPEDDNTHRVVVVAKRMEAQASRLK